jgi:DNA-binding response OmpR family regulator
LQEAAPAAHVDLVRNLEEAQRLVMNAHPDLFVLDADAVSDLSQDFLYDLRTSHPNARAIVLTGVHLATHREQAAGLGAIHFLEKPFPHTDFVDLVQALLSPPGEHDSEKFQGTLSDLHLADIIQLKCMSGSSAALQFTGPQGEKARVYFEKGQVRHATAPGKEGIAAFNEIVHWKGGQISEVSGAALTPRTIDLDWQILLMEAVRKMDETRDEDLTGPAARPSLGGKKVLVIDDSLMLLSFVKEILSEADYHVVPAATAEEGLLAAADDVPDLILLDYVLPDMKGDEVCRHLSQNPITEKVPIVFMSGFGTDLKHDKFSTANVIGSLNKPFTSDLLLKTVEKYMPNGRSEPESKAVETEEPSPAAERSWKEPEPSWKEPEPSWEEPETSAAPEPAWQEPQSTAFEPAWPEHEPEFAPSEEPAWPETSEFPPSPSEVAETAGIAASAGAAGDSWWSAPISPPAHEPSARPESQPSTQRSTFEAPAASPSIATQMEEPLPVHGPFFSGDTSFFSINGALQTIGKEKLTGTMRAFWNNNAAELLARNGEIILVTTHDPQLYCPEVPVTLVSVDVEKTEEARAQQRETGCPVFLTLAQEELILHEPAVQLVQHYGQKLFAQLWTAQRVRFLFDQSDALPDYCRDVPGEADINHWILTTLRTIQLQELEPSADLEPGSIPAYTRDGFNRVQELRLTVAEAQFASQFNGVRSVAQIAKNLRLDFKFASLTLFRFLALEIVECWPPAAIAKPEKRSFFQGLGKTVGFGD